MNKRVTKKAVEVEYHRLLKLLNSKNVLIFDTVGMELVHTIEPFGFGDTFGLRLERVVMYHGDPEWDNGYYDTKDQFLKKIRNRFRIFHSENSDLAELLKNAPKINL